jgi:plasmid stabilization system protein ParE
VTIFFGDGVLELFESLPRPVQKEAARIIDLLVHFPRMYPLRRRGIMKGYRYFAAFEYLFYYSIAGNEIRVSAIIPGRMRRA